MKSILLLFILKSFLLIEIAISDGLMETLAMESNDIIPKLFNSDLRKKIEEKSENFKQNIDLKEKNINFDLILKKLTLHELKKDDIEFKYIKGHEKELQLTLKNFYIETELNTNLLVKTDANITNETDLDLSINLHKEGKPLTTKIMDVINVKFKTLNSKSNEVLFNLDII